MSSALSLAFNMPPFATEIPPNSSWWYAADREGGSGETISTLTDLSGNSITMTAVGSPLMTVHGGYKAIDLDGTNDRFASASITFNGNTQYTIGVVSACEDAAFAPTDPPRNCLIFVGETQGWGIINVSPFQNSIMARYGTRQSYNLPSYTRPSSIGSAITSTVWVKNGDTETLYVNGILVGTFTGKLSTINGCASTLQIGFADISATYFKGKLLEAVGYAGTSNIASPLSQYFNAKYDLS